MFLEVIFFLFPSFESASIDAQALFWRGKMSDSDVKLIVMMYLLITWSFFLFMLDVEFDILFVLKILR